jgi:hypothetical protein
MSYIDDHPMHFNWTKRVASRVRAETYSGYRGNRYRSP